MAPPSRRRTKSQSTLLKFIGSQISPSALQTPSPRLPRSPLRPLSNKSPLRPLPRPSAPPYFAKSTLPSRQRFPLGSTADDAWEVAEAVMSGKQLARPQAYSDKSGCPARRTSDSEDDFEPETMTHRVARQRPKANRRNSTSGLRDDRSSMKKRETRAHNRERKCVGVVTQVPIYNVDVGRDCDLDVPLPVSNPYRMRGMDGQCDVIFVEADKSEMSGTASDSSSQTPAVKSTREDVDYSRRISVVTPKGRGADDVADKEDTFRTPDDCVFATGAHTPTSSDVRAPRKLMRTPVGSAGRDSLDVASPQPMLASRGTMSRKRARPLRSMFDSDSDSGEHPLQPRSVNRDQSSPSAPTYKASNASSSEYESRSDDQNSLSDREQDQGASTPLCQRIAIRSSLRKSAIRRSNARKLRAPIQLDISDDESPVENISNLRAATVGRSGLQHRSKRISLSPESDPTPPSTKKRRLLSRLSTRDSAEGTVEHGAAINTTPTQLPLEATPLATPENRIVDKDFRKPAEWYQERQIEEFSSSSCEAPAVNDVGTDASATKRGRNGGPDVNCRHVLPVRRDILKSFSDEASETPVIQVHGLDHTCTESPAPVTSKISSAQAAEAVEDGHDDTDGDVVDLVDVIDVDEVGAAPCGPLASNDRRTSFDSHLFAAECVEDTISRGEHAENLFFSDNKPPPFNLRILCERGETLIQMKDRLGEEFLMDKVSAAQSEGREIIGGEELGLTTSFNRNVFNRFSKQVVGDQISRERKAKSVTEQALRGEYKFNYRGRDQCGSSNSRLQRKRTTPKKTPSKPRLLNLRRRLHQ